MLSLEPAAFDTLVGYSGVIAAVGGAVGVLYVGGKRVIKTLRAVQRFLADWNGEPSRPGVVRRPGVIEQLADLRVIASGAADAGVSNASRLDQLEPAVRQISAQLHPNGGSTLADAINRIDRKTEALPPAGNGA